MSPLKPVELGLLVALCQEPRHGYALVQRVEKESGGRVSLLPGNLYAILRRLTESGWIQEGSPPHEGDDQRRRYYQITAAGRRRLALEEVALGHQLSLIRSRLAAS